jgi:hypothetical protein
MVHEDSHNADTAVSCCTFDTSHAASPQVVFFGGVADEELGAARAGAVAATALACALAAAGVSVAGGRLGAGSLDAIVGRFAVSRVELARFGHLFGEDGLGPKTRAALGLGEGLLFGAGLAFGLTRRPRRPRLRSDG